MPRTPTMDPEKLQRYRDAIKDLKSVLADMREARQQGMSDGTIGLAAPFMRAVKGLSDGVLALAPGESAAQRTALKSIRDYYDIVQKAVDGVANDSRMGSAGSVVGLGGGAIAGKIRALGQVDWKSDQLRRSSDAR